MTKIVLGRNQADFSRLLWCDDHHGLGDFGAAVVAQVVESGARFVLRLLLKMVLFWHYVGGGVVDRVGSVSELFRHVGLRDAGGGHELGRQVVAVLFVLMVRGGLGGSMVALGEAHQALHLIKAAARGLR